MVNFDAKYWTIYIYFISDYFPGNNFVHILIVYIVIMDNVSRETLDFKMQFEQIKF